MKIKIKIPKPYWIIGSLASASIITVTGYNMIAATANNKETVTISNPTSQVEQVDYSKDIDELKQRLIDAENRVSSLEEKIATLKGSNHENDITDLQNKINKLNNDENSEKVNNLEEELNSIKQKNIERIQILQEKKDRISEIQKELKQLSTQHNFSERFELEGKITELEYQLKTAKKELREEILKKIENSQKQLKELEDKEKAVEDKENNLNIEMKKLQDEMLSM